MPVSIAIISAMDGHFRVRQVTPRWVSEFVALWSHAVLPWEVISLILKTACYSNSVLSLLSWKHLQRRLWGPRLSDAWIESVKTHFACQVFKVEHSLQWRLLIGSLGKAIYSQFLERRSVSSVMFLSQREMCGLKPVKKKCWESIEM